MAGRPAKAPGRPTKPPEAKRVKISQRVDPELHAWVETQIEEGRFKDWPHALDSALRALQAKESGSAKTAKK